MREEEELINVIKGLAIHISAFYGLDLPSIVVAPDGPELFWIFTNEESLTEGALKIFLGWGESKDDRKIFLVTGGGRSLTKEGIFWKRSFGCIRMEKPKEFFVKIDSIMKKAIRIVRDQNPEIIQKMIAEGSQ